MPGSHVGELEPVDIPSASAACALSVGGWRIVLFLDRGSPHRARATRALAKRLGIEFRFLPTACPELNPVEALWRYVKNQILANEPTPDVETAVQRACDALAAMTQSQRRQTAGTLEDFWLAT